MTWLVTILVGLVGGLSATTLLYRWEVRYLREQLENEVEQHRIWFKRATKGADREDS